MADVVVVLGMHRSGTSAAAGVLTKLGGAAPKTLMPANIGNARGYFESSSLAAFHDELLASAGSSWSDWRPFNREWYKSPAAPPFKQRAKDLFAAEFDGLPLPVLKDPRICRFFPFWLEIFRDLQMTPHIAMPIRSPLDVARSLKQLQGISLAKGALLWLRHCLDAEYQTRNEARSIFTFGKLHSDWRGTVDKIAADTSLSWPRLSDRAAHDVENFLTGELLHQHADHAELIAHADIHEWTLRTYEALLELARNPFSNSAMDTLDQVRALLDQSSKMFGRTLIEYEVSIDDLRAQTQALMGERDQSRLREGEIQSQHAAAAAEFAARLEDMQRVHAATVSEKEALSQAIAVSRGELEALREQHQRITAELQVRERQLAEHAAAASAHAARADQAEIAYGETVRERETLSQAIAVSRGELEALRDEHQRLIAELQERQRQLAEHADVAAVQSARADMAEIAHGETIREKEALSHAIAATHGEIATMRDEHQRLIAELQERQRQLAEHADVAAVQSARADMAEIAHGETIREKEALSYAIAATHGEIATMRDEHQRILTELQERQRQLSELADNAAAHAERADQAEIAHKAALDKQKEFAAALAWELDQKSSELQRIQRVSKEHWEKQELAHGRIFNETKKVHEAQIEILRGQLVDAEAAVSYLDQQTLSVRMNLLPQSLRGFWRERQLLRTGLFDNEWYKATYVEVAKSGLSAARHYLEKGFCRGYRPNPFFDTHWYLDRYNDVRRSGVNPLIHYALHGWHDGRDPGPGFQTEFYLKTNPDVRKTGVNPLVHYLHYGRHEGRRPVPSHTSNTESRMR